MNKNISSVTLHLPPFYTLTSSKPFSFLFATPAAWPTTYYAADKSFSQCVCNDMHNSHYCNSSASWACTRCECTTLPPTPPAFLHLRMRVFRAHLTRSWALACRACGIAEARTHCERSPLPHRSREDTQTSAVQKVLLFNLCPPELLLLRDHHAIPINHEFHHDCGISFVPITTHTPIPTRVMLFYV